IVLIAANGETQRRSHPDGSSARGSGTAIGRLQQQELPDTAGDAALGISARRPADWRQTKRDRTIGLQSGDSCLALTMSAPGPAANAERVHDSAITVLRRNYRSATVHPIPDNRVGGIPTRGDVLTLANGKGGPTRVLLSVGTG